MNIRAQAVGMCSQSQNVVNSIVQQFFPIFLKNEGFYAFYFFAGINILLVAFVWFFVPETKKVSLEEMDAVFGGAMLLGVRKSNTRTPLGTKAFQSIQGTRQPRIRGAFRIFGPFATL
jgi:hypothetical protein